MTSLACEHEQVERSYFEIPKSLCLQLEPAREVLLRGFGVEARLNGSLLRGLPEINPEWYWASMGQIR